MSLSKYFAIGLTTLVLLTASPAFAEESSTSTQKNAAKCELKTAERALKYAKETTTADERRSENRLNYDKKYNEQRTE